MVVMVLSQVVAMVLTQVVAMVLSEVVAMVAGSGGMPNSPDMVNVEAKCGYVVGATNSNGYTKY